MEFRKTAIIVIAAATLLSGCNFEDLFAKLATTNEEAGSQAEYYQSKIIEAKQTKINEALTTYPESAVLKNTSKSTNFIGYAFRQTVGGKTTIAVEAMLTNPGVKHYQVWLKGGADNRETVNLGPLVMNQTDDYSLLTTLENSVKRYDTVVVSLDTPPATPGATPEKIVLTGLLSAPKAAPSASPQID